MPILIPFRPPALSPAYTELGLAELIARKNFYDTCARHIWAEHDRCGFSVGDINRRRRSHGADEPLDVMGFETDQAKRRLTFTGSAINRFFPIALQTPQTQQLSGLA